MGKAILKKITNKDFSVLENLPVWCRDTNPQIGDSLIA